MDQFVQTPAYSAVSAPLRELSFPFAFTTVMKRFVFRTAITILLTSMIGCGGQAVAPVSGKITLNGDPMAEVQVIFEPIDGQPDEISTGETDASGNYSLKMIDGSEGALVGTHRVKLTTTKADRMADERTAVPPDRVPPRYRDGSQTFDVPQGGTTSADFHLNSK